MSNNSKQSDKEEFLVSLVTVKNDFLVEDLPISTQTPTAEKRSPLLRIRRNPFSIVLSKLAALLLTPKISNEAEVPENSPSEAESIRERYLHTWFTDRVDPSLYYILFFSPYVDSPTYNQLKRFTQDDRNRNFD